MKLKVPIATSGLITNILSATKNHGMIFLRATIFKSIHKHLDTGLVGNVADLTYLDGVEDCQQIIFAAASRKNLEKHFDENSDFWQKAKTIQHIF